MQLCIPTSGASAAARTTFHANDDFTTHEDDVRLTSEKSHRSEFVSNTDHHSGKEGHLPTQKGSPMIAAMSEDSHTAAEHPRARYLRLPDQRHAHPHPQPRCSLSPWFFSFSTPFPTPPRLVSGRRGRTSSSCSQVSYYLHVVWPSWPVRFAKARRIVIGIPYFLRGVWV